MSTPHRRFWTQDNDQLIAEAAWLTTTASSRYYVVTKVLTPFDADV